MYRLLTGQVPYTAKNVVIKALAHAQAPIPSLHAQRQEISDSLERTYQRMVAKKPAERFQSMKEVIAALEACRSGGSLPAAAPPATSRPAPPSRGRRQKMTAMMALGAAVAVVAGVLVALWLI